MTATKRTPPPEHRPLEPHELALTITESSQRLVFPSAQAEPGGASYIRVLNEQDEEIAYWTMDEWAEEPDLVMGALLGALCRNEGTRTL